MSQPTLEPSDPLQALRLTVPIVLYDPSASTPSRHFRAQVERHLPLPAIQWTHAGEEYRVAGLRPLWYLPDAPEAASSSARPPITRYAAPLVHVRLVTCESALAYREIVQHSIKSWVTAMHEAQMEWMLVYLPAGAVSSHNNTAEYAKVMAKLQRDFGSKQSKYALGCYSRGYSHGATTGLPVKLAPDPSTTGGAASPMALFRREREMTTSRVFRVDLVALSRAEAAADVEQAWASLFWGLAAAAVSGVDQRIYQARQLLMSKIARSVVPGWNALECCMLQESIALSWAQLGQLDAADREYEHASSLFFDTAPRDTAPVSVITSTQPSLPTTYDTPGSHAAGPSFASEAGSSRQSFASRVSRALFGKSRADTPASPMTSPSAVSPDARLQLTPPVMPTSASRIGRTPSTAVSLETLARLHHFRAGCPYYDAHGLQHKTVGDLLGVDLLAMQARLDAWQDGDATREQVASAWARVLPMHSLWHTDLHSLPIRVLAQQHQAGVAEFWQYWLTRRMSIAMAQRRWGYVAMYGSQLIQVLQLALRVICSMGEMSAMQAHCLLASYCLDILLAAGASAPHFENWDRSWKSGLSTGIAMLSIVLQTPQSQPAIAPPAPNSPHSTPPRKLSFVGRALSATGTSLTPDMRGPTPDISLEEASEAWRGLVESARSHIVAYAALVQQLHITPAAHAQLVPVLQTLAQRQSSPTFAALMQCTLDCLAMHNAPDAQQDGYASLLTALGTLQASLCMQARAPAAALAVARRTASEVARCKHEQDALPLLALYASKSLQTGQWYEYMHLAAWLLVAHLQQPAWDQAMRQAWQLAVPAMAMLCAHQRANILLAARASCAGSAWAKVIELGQAQPWDGGSLRLDHAARVLLQIAAGLPAEPGSPASATHSWQPATCNTDWELPGAEVCLPMRPVAHTAVHACGTTGSESGLRAKSPVSIQVGVHVLGAADGLDGSARHSWGSIRQVAVRFQQVLAPGASLLMAAAPGSGSMQPDREAQAQGILACLTAEQPDSIVSIQGTQCLEVRGLAQEQAPAASLWVTSHVQGGPVSLPMHGLHVIRLELQQGLPAGHWMPAAVVLLAETSAGRAVQLVDACPTPLCGNLATATAGRAMSQGLLLKGFASISAAPDLPSQHQQPVAPVDDTSGRICSLEQWSAALSRATQALLAWPAEGSAADDAAANSPMCHVPIRDAVLRSLQAASNLTGALPALWSPGCAPPAAGIGQPRPGNLHSPHEAAELSALFKRSLIVPDVSQAVSFGAVRATPTTRGNMPQAAWSELGQPGTGPGPTSAGGDAVALTGEFAVAVNTQDVSPILRAPPCWYAWFKPWQLAAAPAAKSRAGQAWLAGAPWLTVSCRDEQAVPLQGLSVAASWDMASPGKCRLRVQGSFTADVEDVRLLLPLPRATLQDCTASLNSAGDDVDLHWELSAAQHDPAGYVQVTCKTQPRSLIPAGGAFQWTCTATLAQPAVQLAVGCTLRAGAQCWVSSDDTYVALPQPWSAKLLRVLRSGSNSAGLAAFRLTYAGGTTQPNKHASVDSVVCWLHGEQLASAVPLHSMVITCSCALDVAFRLPAGCTDAQLQDTPFRISVQSSGSDEGSSAWHSPALGLPASPA